MTKTTMIREYRAAGGSVYCQLGLAFNGDEPIEHVVEVSFGEGTPNFHRERQTFHAGTAGFCEALEKFKSAVLSLI